jgi:hypothetical protein
MTLLLPLPLRRRLLLHGVRVRARAGVCAVHGVG